MRKLSIAQKITSVQVNSIKLYLKEVSKIPILTPEQENSCALKAVEGDKQAIEKLIVSNLRFVISVAKQYVSKSATLEDLIEEGNIGLTLAVKNYKPDCGFKFISYAVWLIRKCITDYLAGKTRLVRLPSNLVYGISKMEHIVERLEQVLERRPELQDMEEYVDEDVNESDLKHRIEISNFKFDSIDKEVFHDVDGSSTYGDVLSNSNNDYNADSIACCNDLKIELHPFIEKLKPKQKEVLSYCFGLNGRDTLSLKQIATKLDITTEGVRLIKNKALLNMKRAMTPTQQRFY
jgi:RNA polymerase primary sigma factor